MIRMRILKKKLIRIILIIILFNLNILNTNAQNITTVDYTDLITAIGTVESGLNDNKINGPHAGFLQISKICVTECNRINKQRGIKTRYTLSDRFNHKKSIEMFYIIQSYYNVKNDFDYAILLWNQGCSVMKKPKRKTNYYIKVMIIYKKIKCLSK